MPSRQGKSYKSEKKLRINEADLDPSRSTRKCVFGVEKPVQERIPPRTLGIPAAESLRWNQDSSSLSLPSGLIQEARA
ncbi:hypothetical protein TURU_162444 [Turdus rufiventris]|nr:hypothetical protein TURU_162444 [Turdus rufiventris]